jgi:hypothetical protein
MPRNLITFAQNAGRLDKLVVEDRLDYRLYTLVCHPGHGDSFVTLKEAPDAFLGDWAQAYVRDCKNEQDCPAYRERLARCLFN